MSRTKACAQPLGRADRAAAGAMGCVVMRYKAPATATRPSEASFAIVNDVLTRVPVRTPKKLITARIPIRAVRIESFARGCTAPGQNSPRYTAKRLALAAHDARRTNHTSQAT